MSTAAHRTRLTAARVAAQPARHGATERRPPLEVVGPRGRRIRRRRVAPVLSAAVVSCSLLLVVIGHAELAQGQVRLARVQAAITSAHLVHQHEVLALASLENPSRVMQVAEVTLHMVAPGQVQQLAHVPLGVALPAPKLLPARKVVPATPVTPAASTSSTRAAAPGG